ncbi:MAG: phosphatidate cytidylyltransferase [Chitinophagales bacterium]|jgi:phosphatidate cytidylyltransferase|nr:phosphatidate cytidylyltransferase [Chitinophagales bacterium]
MAFNWQTFKTRALTALVFVAVMLTGLLVNHWSFFLLFSVIHFGCWWEYFKLIGKNFQTSFHIYTQLGFMLLGYGLFLWFCGDSFQLGTYLLRDNFSMPVSVAGFILTVIGIFRQGPLHLNAFGAALLGIFYISMSWGMMLSLYPATDISYRDSYFIFKAGFLPVLIIAAIWINDTMAYIVGSLIGRTPLSAISPKKTWEGTIGGIILAVVVTGLLIPRIYTGENEMSFFIFTGTIALIAAVTGTFGDLLESKLKRLAGVKDSGSIMPGHGGFLDRFDSLLIAVPFVWGFIQLINN